MNLRQVTAPKLTAQLIDKPLLTHMAYNLYDVQGFINSNSYNIIILDITQEHQLSNRTDDSIGSSTINNQMIYLIVYQEK